ncbi:MAG TPA: hypothetical protein VHW71_02655 [Steroidobacteraceae bacterium]|jgi:hypothetical protein|nr:hypothetical protein [Steroidobacteraceae bacterium]
MDNMVSGTAAGSMSREEQTALQNRGGIGATLKLVLLWLAVMLPMVWGVMHVLDGTLVLVP